MKTLARAGIAGPIWFTILVVIQSVLQPDYSQIEQPISALSAWRLGWLQNLNFVVMGALSIAFALGLELGVARRRGGWIALVLMVTSGVGLILAGVFPWRREGIELVEPAAHVVGAFFVFLGGGLGFVAMSFRMAADPNWRGLMTYTRTCGIALVAMFFTLGFLAIDDGAPLHPWAGLWQRLMLVVWFPCIVVLSSKLLGLAKKIDSAHDKTKAQARGASWGSV